MSDRSNDAADTPLASPDRDPEEGWLTQAVRATTIAELRAVASAARSRGELTARDQAWCRALAAHLENVDAVAMRVAVAQLGAVTT